MTRRAGLPASAASAVLLPVHAALAQWSPGCDDLQRAAAAGMEMRIAADDAQIAPPMSVRELTCMSFFFDGDIFNVVTDFGGYLVGMLTEMAVPPQPGGQPPRTIAGQLLSAMRVAPPAGPPPWQAVTPGMGERLTDFEAKMAEGRTARLFDQAEQAGAAALAAMERFARGQGAPLLGRIGKAAAGDDLAAVLAGMTHGGPQAALRAEFDRAIGGDRRFADAYWEMKRALQLYGEARLAAGRDAAARGLPAERLAGLERMDAALGEAAAKVPGEALGRSLLEEAGAEVAEVLREAADKVAAAVASAAAGVKAKFAGAAPGPSPSA